MSKNSTDENQMGYAIPQLPFSLIPAKFWTEAIKTLYGEQFVFFGLTDKFKVMGPKGEITVGPFHNGFSLKLMDVDEDLEKGFHIRLQLVDYHNFSDTGDIDITYDKLNGDGEATIYVEDETKIIETFATFNQTRNWRSLVEEYNHNKTIFYKKYIEFFYSAKFTLKVNNLWYKVKGDTATLLGFKETITILKSNSDSIFQAIITEFPTKNLQIRAIVNRAMYFPGTPEPIVTASAESKHKGIWVTLFKGDKYDVDFVQEIFLKGLTTEIIRKHVQDFIVSRNDATSYFL